MSRGVTLDLVGRRFGRLVVRRYLGRDSQGKSRWECACDCGGATAARGGNLTGGHSKSCGCMGGLVIKYVCTNCKGGCRRPDGLCGECAAALGAPVTPRRACAGCGKNCRSEAGLCHRCKRRRYGATGRPPRLYTDARTGQADTLAGWAQRLGVSRAGLWKAAGAPCP